MRSDVLESSILREQFPEFRNIAVVDQDWSFADLKQYAAQTHASDFVVVDGDWHYKGMISLRNVHIKKEDEKNPLANYLEEIPAVESSQNLSAALSVILDHDIDKVAITENEKLAGYVRYRDIFEAYNLKMKQL
jgi:predicted transcriptional regulator